MVLQGHTTVGPEVPLTEQLRQRSTPRLPTTGFCWSTRTCLAPMPTTMPTGSRIHGRKRQRRSIALQTPMWPFHSNRVTAAGTTARLTETRSALWKSAAMAQLGLSSLKPTSPLSKKRVWWSTAQIRSNAVTRCSQILNQVMKPTTPAFLNLTSRKLLEAKVKFGFVSVGSAHGVILGRLMTSTLLTSKRTTPASTTT